MAVEKEQAKAPEESKTSAETDMGRKAPSTAPTPSWFTPKRYFLVLVHIYIYMMFHEFEEKDASLNRGLYSYLRRLEFFHVFPFRIQHAVDLRLNFLISFFYQFPL